MASEQKHEHPLTSKLYFTMAELAPLLGWSTRRTRDHLKRMGVLEKHAGRWVASRERLRAQLPEVDLAILMQQLD